MHDNVGSCSRVDFGGYQTNTTRALTRRKCSVFPTGSSRTRRGSTVLLNRGLPKRAIRSTQLSSGVRTVWKPCGRKYTWQRAMQQAGLLLAEGHLTRRRFGAMLGRIALLRYPRDRSALARSSSGICLQRARQGEVLQKWRNIGQFRRYWCGSQTVGGAPDENCFTMSQTGGVGVKSAPCLFQKEIPV